MVDTTAPDLALQGVDDAIVDGQLGYAIGAEAGSTVRVASASAGIDTTYTADADLWQDVTPVEDGPQEVGITATDVHGNKVETVFTTTVTSPLRRGGCGSVR